MKNPFQYSMGQLLGAVTLFCLGLGEFGWLWKPGSDHLIGILTFIAFGAILGGSLGMQSHRSIIFALIGAFLGLQAAVVFEFILRFIFSFFVT
jgi:hypothetical protein